ncbi:MAG TPA: trimethylamine methyltransferase family protein, partial [Thermoleophilia bacterium]|nr:trimethylamine methyltransferase family protein [Thermoleophilia bacterium]
ICIEMSRFYGIRSMGSAITADAKANDLQAGAEGMLTGLACALAGAESILAFGLLDGAQIVSLAKTVLDCDTVGAIRRFVRDDPVDEAAALLDDIREVGVGGHYLGRRSTRAGLRAGALWRPELFQRGPFESYGGRTLVDDAIARVDELLAVHEVPPLDDDVRRHIDQVTGSFRRTMARV